MQNPTYLTCSRHSIYYFRYPLPKALHEPGKARDFKFSLQTKDSRKALHLSRLLVYLTDFLIKQGMAYGMKYSEIQSVLKRYFTWRLQMLRKGIEQRGPWSEESTNNFAFTQSFGPYFFDGEAETLSPLIERYELPLEQGTDAYKMFSDEYARWFDEFCTKAIKQNNDYGQIGFDGEETKPIDVDYTVEEQMTLTDMIDGYFKEGLRSGGWSDNTQKSYKQMLSLLSRIVGATKLCSQIRVKDCRKVKDILSDLPSRHSTLKQTKGKSIREILDMDLSPKLTVKTINKHLVAFSSLFKWGVVNGYITTNYFQGMSLKQPNKNEPARKGFDQEQVKVMLSELTRTDSSLVKKDYQKWGALIGLYTGARLNEIAQLKVEDIREVDGVLSFDINDLGDNKKLKNTSSKRLIPVHSNLIRLGFLEYVESVKDKEKDRLLYELTFDRNNGYGRNLGRWFNERFLKTLGLKTGKLVFHSLRHTMVTELLRAGVEPSKAKAVVGHAQEGVTLQVYFDQGYKVSQLRDAIERVHTQEG